MKNIAIQVLEEIGKSLEDFEGLCGELADEVLHRFPDAKLLVIEPEDWVNGLAVERDGFGWDYHIVPIINDAVHDAWFPELVLSPKEYIQQAFPGRDDVKAKIYGKDKAIYLEI